MIASTLSTLLCLTVAYLTGWAMVAVGGALAAVAHHLWHPIRARRVLLGRLEAR